MAKKTKAAASENKAEKQAVALGLKKEMTTVSFRMDKLMKKKAESLFGELGLSMSAALNMFLAQAVRERGLPFQPHAQRQQGGTPAVSEKNTGALEDSAGYLALEELWDEL